MITDKDRIEWFENEAKKGGCPALVNDDNGHWAISQNGVQNVVAGEKMQDVWTSFHIKAKDWKKSVRAAIDAQIKRKVTP